MLILIDSSDVRKRRGLCTLFCFGEDLLNRFFEPRRERNRHERNCYVAVPCSLVLTAATLEEWLNNSSATGARSK